MHRSLVFAVLSLAASPHARAQWEIQQSSTTASLRGIHAVSVEIAWASGTHGTILRTLDGGAHWVPCAMPPDAGKLDFRGIWAWDALTAFVMSSGPGEQSRLYTTSDGCAHWTLNITNSEKEGFWDALVFQSKNGLLLGDPVHGRFETHAITFGNAAFTDTASCPADVGEAAFAASNSSVVVFGNGRYLMVTGGKAGPLALLSPLLAFKNAAKPCLPVTLPLAHGSEAAGAFSVFFSDEKHGVVVGGDYKKPADSTGTAAWTKDGGYHWTAAKTPPHGYRSSVAWDPATKCWIAAGTNGSDLSCDSGKTWRSLDDGNWNALSLPFVVGPNGRIAKMTEPQPGQK